jgi:RHS repeat-associated protein
LGDTPVATIRPGTPVLIYYVQSNHLNTPMAVTQPSSNKFAWQWHPDAFGNGTPSQNPQGLGTFVYNLRFPGQYYDTETGQYYNYFRDYDPQVGRYVESDPIGLEAGTNTFAYVGSAPTGDSDPFGLDKLIQYVDNTALGSMGVMYPSLVFIYDTDTNQISGPYRGSTQPDQTRSACNGGCVSSAPGVYKYKRGLFPNRPMKPGVQRYIALLLGTVPATGPNPNHNGNASLTGVWIHRGGRKSTTSEGCLTIDPSDWPSFISNFGRGASGTVNVMR